jgi:hypothetical protein|tara:strand:+ start:106 stop:600 length:495 start_codon:yes stop_codon:yes gene_type:complete
MGLFRKSKEEKEIDAEGRVVGRNFSKKEKGYKPLEASTVEFSSKNGLHISDDELHQICDGLAISRTENLVSKITIYGRTPLTNEDFELTQIRTSGDEPTGKLQEYYISANTNLDIEGQVAIRNTKRTDIPIIQSDDEIHLLCRFDKIEDQNFSIRVDISRKEVP